MVERSPARGAVARAGRKQFNPAMIYEHGSEHSLRDTISLGRPNYYVIHSTISATTGLGKGRAGAMDNPDDLQLQGMNAPASVAGML